MVDPKLLAISGSLRAESLNTKLVREAVRLFGPAQVSYADLRLPLYDGDLEDEHGFPQAVQTLHDQMQAADGIIISTPEYNKNLPGVLKNALDWVSRIKPMPMGGKPLAIMSAAAGREGGARAQFSLRHCLVPFRPRVLSGPEMMLAGASKEFDDDGQLTSDIYTKTLSNLMDELRAEIELTADTK